MAEVIREIIYRTIDDELVPVLVILPKVEREGHNVNFCIRMEDLWMYTPDKNPNFDKWMYYVVQQIYHQFNLGVVVSSQRMAEVATVIEDGIEELLSATPEPLLPPVTPPRGRSGDGMKTNGNKVII
jgi:hypothetical protein